MPKARVSLGMPVYNGERYLPDALRAIANQDYSDFELLISDNASTDRTREICMDFAGTDSRILYSRNDRNVGLAANHNRTVALARGEFFKWVSHDDDFPRSMLTRLVETLSCSPPSVVAVYAQCQYVDENGVPQEIDSDRVANDSDWPHVRLNHLIRNIHMYSSVYSLVRTDVMRKTRLMGGYPGSDHVLCAELSMLGKFVEIPEPLLRIRRHRGRTHSAHTTLDSLKRLFDPDYKPGIVGLGLWTRINLELIRSAWLIPLAPGPKALCVVVAAFKPQWESLRALGGRWKDAVFGASK